MDIPVVVSAYNRPNALMRLLGSLNNAFYPEKVKLYISIDGGGDSRVLEVAEEFDWQHGEKEVIHHSKNFGLRNHILMCTGIVSNHDGIVVLEDDLFVSPYYYDYANKALQFYEREDIVAGISLYSHCFNETAEMPFLPLNDSSDVFFMQLAASWGQCFTKDQWKDYIDYKKATDDSKKCIERKLPVNIKSWPSSSWKKDFVKYMLGSGKYFLYPKQSLSTNFGDRGENHINDRHFQVALLQGKQDYRFIGFDSSRSKYDAYCEILPECLKAYNRTLQSYEFCVDLYATKPIKNIETDYLLSTRNVKNPLYHFCREMIPHEMNVIQQIKGNDIYFARTQLFNPGMPSLSTSNIVYFHRLPVWHLKTKIINGGKKVTLCSKEETLLRIYNTIIGKLMLAPLLLIYKLYRFFKKTFK